MIHYIFTKTIKTMKKILFTLLMSSICIAAGAQVTDNESKLRDKKSTADTTQGWKFGGTGKV